MSKDKSSFKSVKIKQFKDLNMWGTPMGTPQDPANHPASSNKEGKQMMDHFDMSAEGNTGERNDGSRRY